MRIERLGADALQVRASSKLNLFLDVLGRRTDGYHELLSLFHEIDWGDAIELRRAPGRRGELRFACGAPGVPPGEANLCVRAARALLAEPWFPCEGALELRLEKRLPMGSGLGGGSADASAVLLGLAELCEVGGAHRERLPALALALGSDCPFFLRGGTCVGRGRGELLERRVPPLLQGGALHFCLALPGRELATPEVFARFAAEPSYAARAGRFQRLLNAADREALERAMFNRLEPIACQLDPELRELQNALAALWGRRVSMTGSGSTFFAVFADHAAASTAASEAGERLGARFPRLRLEVAASAAGSAGEARA